MTTSRAETAAWASRGPPPKKTATAIAKGHHGGDLRYLGAQDEHQQVGHQEPHRDPDG